MTDNTAVAPVEPVSAPAAITAPAVTPIEAPVVAPELVSESPQTLLAVEPPKAVEAPVRQDDTKTPTPPIEPIQKAPEAVITNTDGGQTAEPAPPPSTGEAVKPSYEPFKFPEGVTLEPERVGKFTELLSGLELDGKADHATVQKFGQEAVNFHVNEVNRVVNDLNKAYQDAWGKQKNDWKEAVLKDPDIGGNRLQATIDSANNFIRTHGGTQEQQNEFRSVMESSGLGNHPVIIRLLANAGRGMSEGTPLAAPKPAPAPKSKTQTLYGKSQ